jgi:hypothetical protein
MKLTQEQIFEKYPKIFKEKDLPPQQTCMCWGLEVPYAWMPVIERLCNAMQNYAWVSSNTPKMQVVAEQVKEKYGTMRFYFRIEIEKPFDELNEKQKQEVHNRRREVEGMIFMADSVINGLPEFYEQLKSVMEEEK